MPSLQQLEEFKSSFKDVGSEALILTNQHIPFEDVSLPDNEPPAPFPEGLEGRPDTGFGPDSGGLGFPDLDLPGMGGGLPPGLDIPGMDDGFPGLDGGLPPVQEGLDTGDDFGFGDLLGDLPADPAAVDLPGETLETPGIPETAAMPPEDQGSPPDDSPAMDFGDLPDFGAEPGGDAGDLPMDLLSGFADDIESGGLPAEGESAEAEQADSGYSPDDAAAGEEPVSESPPETPAGTGTKTGESEEFPSFSGMDLSGAMDMGSEVREPDAAAGGTSAAAEPGDFNPDGFSDTEEFAMPEGFDLGETGGEAPSPDQESFDPGGDLETESADSGGETQEGVDAGGFDLGGDFSLPDFDTEEDTAGNEPEKAGGEGSDEFADFGGGESFDLGSEGSLDLGSEDSPSNLEDLGSDGFPTGDAETSDTADTFDAFDLGGEEPDFSAPAEESAADVFGAENFSLDGFDDAFEKPGAKPGAKPGPRPAARPAASDDVEEIQLSEEDYTRLQNTLSGYPLNLRIACEELIAEQAVAPDLMSAMIKLLVKGAPAKEAASLAGKILGKTIPIPKGYAKQTGADLEAEQSSFGYIFVHSFLPILRIVGGIALVLGSLAYLGFRFIYTPIKAENLYKEGYERLKTGEYARANERFLRAFETHRVKNWFYTYAEGFRDERQYIFAEQKYDELLRVYSRDKKGSLDYAAMETYYLRNYEKADRIIRTNILDWSVNDREGLTALAENNLAWGETDPSRYEEARAAYARLIERYGSQDPFMEGMLKYFIRTDKLAEVLPLQAYFMGDPKKRRIGVPTLAELGGYLLDKRFEEVPGVPDEYVEEIDGIRDVLLRAIKEDGGYPESYYHLARYYNRYGSGQEERLTLEKAVQVFAAAQEDNSRRAAYRVDSHRRYGEVLIKAREFFPAEAELLRGRRIYEDARSRGVLKTRSEFGRIYADLGDLEFFTKNGDMEAALSLYLEGEQNGWAPPEIQYRMGAAHYQMGQWEEALQRFFPISGAMPNNKRLLYALGNVSYMRGNYFAAQGYYNRLMDLLAAERVRFPNLSPGSRPEEMDLAERIMVADNNLGVTLETLTQISGNTSYRSRALGLFSESIRAWDVLTRNPESMARMRPVKDLYGPGVNLAFFNAQNILRPQPGYEPQIFMRIDRDAPEPSDWEDLVSRDYRLSDNLFPQE
jgi:tetratricopeptide (TPR) repeat protein